MDPVRLIYATCPDLDTARAIARVLVEESLVACANYWSGMESCYRWQGAIETAPEAVLLVKTVASRVSAVVDRMVALHPYEVPAVMVLPLDGGHGPYLDWIRASTHAGP